MKTKKSEPPGAANTERPVKRGYEVMNNNTTAELEKSSVQEGLRYLLLVVKLLEDAGLTVLTARADNTHGNSVLVSSECAKLRKWAENRCLKLDVFQFRGMYNDWRISTYYQGVEITSYMTNEEKEAYDQEISDAAEEA